MEGTPVHQQLTAKIGSPPSERIDRLWQMLCDEEEAGLLMLMPGTVEELSGKSGIATDRLPAMLDALFRKGVVFERERDGKTTYSMPRHLIQFHDATILWPEPPEGFIALWSEYMEHEYPAIAKMLASMDIPPVTRVIPVGEVVEGGGSRILPFENAADIVDQARKLAVTPCTCRLTAKKCDSPIDVCMQLNRAAEYAIKRGTGREITREEAKEILLKSEKAGLVHVTDNRAANGHIICNCCSCCCIVLPVIQQERKRVLLAPSRFLPDVDAETCTLCQTCIELCPVRALSLEATDVGERVTVDDELCMGCGQCAYQCPEDAIALREVRTPDFVPGAVA